MINEEKFTKTKKAMAMRKAVKKIKEDFWNPKKVESWIFWGTVLLGLPLITELAGGSFLETLVVCLISAAVINILCCYGEYEEYIDEFNKLKK